MVKAAVCVFRIEFCQNPHRNSLNKMLEVITTHNAYQSHTVASHHCCYLQHLLLYMNQTLCEVLARLCTNGDELRRSVFCVFCHSGES